MRTFITGIAPEQTLTDLLDGWRRRLAPRAA
jgi:hypothetical protein